MFELKRLSSEGVAAALEKATRYRLLNEPGEAESICRDVLAVDPGNQQALVILLLALTDQFDRGLATPSREAEEVVSRLENEYSRSYYHGIVCERRAKTLLRRGGPGSGHAVYHWLEEAMKHFERAERLRPEGNDDSILRWNACVRLFARHPQLEPEPADTFRPLLE